MAATKKTAARESEAALDDDKKSPGPQDRDYDEITYFPSDGDPIRTTWNGVKFNAHIPVKIARKHTVQVPERVETQLADGTIVSRTVEKRIPMVELALGNCRFGVNGNPPAAREEAKAKTPETPDEYRAYAMRWIASATEPGAMDARWVAEQTLRDKCGCDDADVRYLRPFFESRHEVLSGGSGGKGLREIPVGLSKEEMAMGVR
jgi:hypothetical protein